MYLVGAPVPTIVLALVFSAAAVIAVAVAGERIPAGRWRGVVIFVGWVFAMRVALDVVAGGAVDDPDTLQLAARQAARVAVLIIGVLALTAITPARDVVEELETTRMPRAARLLVMMLVQYPRVLRDRYDQIVEAQVARGADRPRSLAQRIAYGARVLLPMMQSELNAIGERAGLIHLRGLDVDVAIPDDARRRTGADLIALLIAIGGMAAALVFRISR